jgi:hypothetical protein
VSGDNNVCKENFLNWRNVYRTPRHTFLICQTYCGKVAVWMLRRYTFTMSNNLLEVTANLQIALKEAGDAERKYTDALESIKPLEAAAIEKRNAVSVLMNQYRDLTQPANEEVPVGRKRRGSGAKRAPRSLTAIVMTSATRLLGQLHSGGTAKKQALNQTLNRVRAMAAERKETVTAEIEKMVTDRAAEIWTK